MSNPTITLTLDNQDLRSIIAILSSKQKHYRKNMLDLQDNPTPMHDELLEADIAIEKVKVKLINQQQAQLV